jgi:hypothetical protein
MALPAEGAISLSAIQTEFGGSNPISLSEYYRNGGGGYVVDPPDSAGTVPTSGAISISNFYATSHVNLVTEYATTTSNSYGTWTTVDNVRVLDASTGSCTPPAESGDLYSVDVTNFGFDSSIPSGRSLLWVKIGFRSRASSIASPRIPSVAAELHVSGSYKTEHYATMTSTSLSDYVSGQLTWSGMSRSDLLDANLRIFLYHENGGTSTATIYTDAVWIQAAYGS